MSDDEKASGSESRSARRSRKARDERSGENSADRRSFEGEQSSLASPSTSSEASDVASVESSVEPESSDLIAELRDRVESTGDAIREMRDAVGDPAVGRAAARMSQGLAFAQRVRAQVRRDHPGVDVPLVPPVCPVLGVSLAGHRGWALVAVDPNGGFVTGNVEVVSRRAAELLGAHGSAEEHERVAEWLRRKGAQG